MKSSIRFFALSATVVAALFSMTSHAAGLNLGGTTNEGGTGIGVGTATAGAAAAASSNAVAIQGQAQGQVQSATANSGGNSQSVTVQGDTTYRTAATAYAAPLAASNGTCMGSSSVGAQGTFGLSFGTTWTDDSCDLRYDAQALAAVGQGTAAIARLCMKPEIAQAMELAGTPCKTKAKTAAAPAGVVAPTVTSAAYTGSDPLVLKRLGLTK
jgi:hypothetical protein